MENKGGLKSLQQQLQHDCELCFGKPISFAPRAMAAFIETSRAYGLFDAQLHMMSDFDCFLGVVANSPACADILFHKGIDVQNLAENTYEISAENPSITIDGRPLPKGKISKKRKRRETATRKKMVETLKVPEKSIANGRIQAEKYSKSVYLINYKAILDDIFKQEFPYPSGFTITGKKIQNTGIITELDIFIGALEAARKRLLPNQTGRNLLISSGISRDGYSDEDGDNFLLGIELACSSVLDMDISHSNQQFVIYIDEKKKLRLRPFGANIFGALEESVLPMGPFIFRGGVVQPLSSASLYSTDIISQLEDMINSRQCSEQDFQDFFELYPYLLTCLDYKKAHPQPILYKDEGGRLIPDFFLEKIDSGWDAILDLKKPYDSMVVRRRNRIYFKQWAQDAIAQLQYYGEWFENPANRQCFEGALGLQAKVFRPKMVIVAGRLHHFLDDIERMRLISNQQSRIEFWTYDDILKRAKRYNQMFTR